MSNDVTKKRNRISVQETEVITLEKPESTKQNRFENANQSPEEFDWEAHQAECPTNFRKPNPHVKAPKGVKVYSREKYAQELLNLMEGFDSKFNIKYSIKSGEIHEGPVYAVAEGWASIDVGYKEMVYVDLGRETQYSKEKLIVGNKVSVKILDDKSESTRGFIIGSVDAGLKQSVKNDIYAAIESGNTAYLGKVDSMIPGGGYMVIIEGVECFMPGSLAGINKLHDFESIIGQEIYVVPVSFSQEKGTIVVSHRKYLQALIPNKIEALKSSIDEQKTGHITGTTKYGVFVEFDGCLTGMIHINDLDEETAKKHRERNANPGDEISFKIKEILSETKIILTQKEKTETVDPWKGISQRYSKPTQVQGTVKSTKEYGVFVEVEEGVVGLLHISELPDGFDVSSVSKGDKITVMVNRVEEETRKVFLKL